ncbi:dTDP-L-rhamnose 4-epimerase [Fontibacillus phaseoli]|uniref:dTDP-L-rhamnose 4-epimerase n=1 Tax=Fontibacillus phaseoli TaxID=1416533 RepID=A0A369BCE7_9BACL|nr:NAD-dependent epimerase/dehydratase family protein [Fontibacillus phaseoli]RCX17344.1 dTDP-L-rhamnose 4-epimerase [Fontibacillus phaseoli]
MNVLVTGGAGFIGQHTVHRLVSEGYRVTVLDNFMSRVHMDAPEPDFPRDVQVVRADLLDRSRLEQLLRQANSIIHLAAYQDYLTDFSSFFATNSVGTSLIYELILENKLHIDKIVVASTQAVYGDGKYLCPEHGHFYGSRPLKQLELGDWEMKCPVCNGPSTWTALDESDANPVTPYGISKFAAERFAISMGEKYGIPTTCLRYSLVQGPGQSIYNAYSGIGRIFNQQLMNDKPLTIFEDGEQNRDFVHVKDVAEANLLALESHLTTGQIYNVGGEIPTTVNEYARKLISLYGGGYEMEAPQLFRIGDARHTFSSSAKLTAMGWQRKYTLDEIIRDAKAWFNLRNEQKDRSGEAIVVMSGQGVLRKSRQGH